jgi:hypothetical protein
VFLPFSSKYLDEPKSQILTTPSEEIKTFSGFRSLWAISEIAKIRRMKMDSGGDTFFVCVCKASEYLIDVFLDC